MTNKKKLVIGSRSSDLALWQAKFVKKEIEKNKKDIEVEIKHIKTKGDKIVDVALSKIGDKGLFTKELEIQLLQENIDIAVHSLKDLQTAIPEGLKIAAITKRHPIEDVLIAREKGTTIEDIPEGGTVATGSLRRRSQLRHLRPDLKVEELRGNVPTRIKKFLDSDWDAIILARAGVEILKMEKHISSIIPPDVMLPAVGQGALGIEINVENRFAYDVLQSINDENTQSAALAERAFLRKLEGGCQVPIGVLTKIKSNGLYLEGIVGTIDGSVTYRKKKRGSKKTPEKLGINLAEDLVKAGAKEILDEIYRNSRS